MDKLTLEEINGKLKNLSGWVYTDGTIKKVFNTRGFPETMGFVVSVGSICQKLNHHPDYINLKFRQVEISFSTHSAGGITLKDIEIAELIEKLPL